MRACPHLVQFTSEHNMTNCDQQNNGVQPANKANLNFGQSQIVGNYFAVTAFFVHL